MKKFPKFVAITKTCKTVKIETYKLWQNAEVPGKPYYYKYIGKTDFSQSINEHIKKTQGDSIHSWASILGGYKKEERILIGFDSEKEFQDWLFIEKI